MTRNVNPIKLREYLAAGLPVVSTPLPEAVRYAPDVLVAQDRESFCRQCDLAVTLNDPQARRRRSARMAGESWEAVVERLSAIVASVTRTQEEPDPRPGTRRPCTAQTSAADTNLASIGASG